MTSNFLDPSNGRTDSERQKNDSERVEAWGDKLTRDLSRCNEIGFPALQDITWWKLSI